MAGADVRAFLGCQGLGVFADWLDSLPRRPRRVVLVPTAGNRFPATPWVDEVSAHLVGCGLDVDRLDLEGAQPTEVQLALAQADLVFVTGGHPIFLLEHARRSGFAPMVQQAVHAGRMAYAGMSAGASVAGPDLARYWGTDDPGWVESTEGLGLVEFFPLSYANRGRQERYAELIAAEGDRYKFVPFRDDQAVLVTGTTWQLRDSSIV